MDMKRILQAMDGVASKPVEGASDMSKFLSIIQKNDVKHLKEEKNNNEVLSEGANPHKVSLPVQMAMQHYQKPQTEKKKRPALIDKYLQEVQEEQLQEKRERKQLINQYAQTIAERVLMKESKDVISEKSTTEKQARTMAAAAHDPKFAKKLGIKTSVAKEFNKADTGTKQLSNAMKKKKVKENEIPGHSMGFNPGPGGPGLMPNESHENQPDVVSMDVPLLIRIMEFAREDAKTDMDLHNVAERLIAMSEEGQTLTMDDYNAIMGQVDEARKIKPKRKTDPCWSNYHQVGMKKKDGKEVPNCVPRNSKLDELSNEKLGAYKAAAYNSARKADQEGKYSLGDKRFAGINKATNKQFANDLKKYTGK